MKPIIIYSDYICPFCFIGKERIDKLEKEFNAAVEWRGFEIHPETPKAGSKLEDLNMDESYIEMMRDNVMKLANEAGLNIIFPSKLSNSNLALEIAEYAKEKGKFKEINDLIFKAYWQEEKDIGNKGIMFNIAKKVGLNIKELKEYLENGKAKNKLNEYLDERRRYEITGVPTFIIGNGVIVGAQPYEVLKRAMQE